MDLSSFPGGGLGAGMLGLGLLGDLGGAFSSWQQQQRMRNLYKQAMDPNQIVANARAYADPLWTQIGPQLGRQAAAQLGMSGTYSGAYGDMLQQQALAGAYANLYNQGANNYLNRLNLALGSVGPSYGTTGATGDAMKNLMMYSLLAKAGVGGVPSAGLSASPAGGMADTGNGGYSYTPFGTSSLAAQFGATPPMLTTDPHFAAMNPYELP